MGEYKYTVFGKEGIPEVKEMWLQLNEHHRSNSVHFKGRFEENDFQKRMGRYFESEELKVHLIIVSNEEEKVGYCLSVLEGQRGEIASLYLKNCVRGERIGEELMSRSLDWLEESEAEDLIIGVACGNEKVLGFYEKFGFYPKNITLSRK